ncbi:hypothetical protein D3C84_819960 [compost metagenome]
MTGLGFGITVDAVQAVAIPAGTRSRIVEVGADMHMVCVEAQQLMPVEGRFSRTLHPRQRQGAPAFVELPQPILVAICLRIPHLGQAHQGALIAAPHQRRIGRHQQVGRLPVDADGVAR